MNAIKRVALCAAVCGALGGCEPLRTVAPNTVAGFEAGGFLGAADGATGAIVMRCEKLDGVRVSVDQLGEEFGAEIALERARKLRQGVCGAAEAINRPSGDLGAGDKLEELESDG